LHRRKKPGRRPAVAKRREHPELGRATPKAAEQPAILESGAAPTPGIVLDEPASFGSQESPETDIAPSVLGHATVGRAESTETDVAPSVLDQSPLPAAAPHGPETCSEEDGGRVSAEDLH
jgi:hypothetical protein